MKKFFKAVQQIASDAFSGTRDHDILIAGAAIAFYTIFSLPGLLITVVMVAGLILGQQAVQGKLAEQISSLIGPKAADAIEKILKNIELTGSGTIGTVIGVATLLFSATTVFITLQQALNTVWGVKAKPKKGWLKLITNRVISLGVVISMGFILLVSLVVETLLEVFMDKLSYIIGDHSATLLDVSGFVSTYLVVMVLIGLIFKLLPDVRLTWKQIWFGSFITASLFILGKFLIGFYMGQSDFTATYETAASIILILIWVYYSTVIVLFGAEITRAIINFRGEVVEPSPSAVKVFMKEVENVGEDMKNRIIDN
jgi:membrane protein